MFIVVAVLTLQPEDNFKLLISRTDRRFKIKFARRKNYAGESADSFIK